MIAGFRCKIGRIIDQNAAMTQVTDVTVVGLLIQANKYISVVPHGFHGLITYTHLKQTRSAENFGGEGAGGIDIIPPAYGSPWEDISPRNGSPTSTPPRT